MLCSREFPDDADYLLGRAQMLARLGQNAAAVETAERALDIAPDYEDVWQLRLQLAERAGDDAAVAALRAEVAARFPDTTWWQPSTVPLEYRRWLSGGFGADRLSNGAPDWSRQFLRIDWQTRTAGVLFGEISRSERFEESDSSLYAGGVWEVLPEWQLGAALAVTKEARFLPELELSVDATRAWTAGWGTTFGFRHRDYATGDVSSYSFTGEKYISDYRIAYRLDHSRQSGAESALTSRAHADAGTRATGATSALRSVPVRRSRSSASISCCTPPLPTSRSPATRRCRRDSR